MAGIDFDMLAYDIAKTLSRYEYPLDVSADDIRPALPAFIASVKANAETSELDAAYNDSFDF